MKVGTKSVLFGVHCFLIHPIFVALAWIKLYGFPLNPLIWLSFFVHDLGYWGKPNMDGKEGEEHPELGAKIMGIFGRRWYEFARYHSRFLAKKDGKPYSKLCVADKLSIALTPAWIYLPLAKASGELEEYMRRATIQTKKDYCNMFSVEFYLITSGVNRSWLMGCQRYTERWALEHKDLREDTWTNKR